MIAQEPAPAEPAAAGPLVAVDGLTFRYRRASTPAIRDVSLEVHPGEVVLVAGPSGCGKSTLIRAINGLIPHAYPGELAGTVLVEGRPTTELKLREIAATVGTVLQDPAKQIVGSTVESELAFGPENLGLERGIIRDRLREVVAEAGIEPLVGRETAALSGGERQLLAVAGILMMRPRLYVVDEPLANLDPATAHRLLAILRALADAGDAVVIVEHRVEEALDLQPDRVLYMEEGETRYLGPLAGFLDVADPVSVKLPFDVVLRRVRDERRERRSARRSRPRRRRPRRPPSPTSRACRGSSSAGSMPASATRRSCTAWMRASAAPRSSRCSAPTARARRPRSGPR